MVLDLETKATLTQEKAPAHLHDAALGDAPDTLYIAGHGKVAVYELKG